VATVFGQAGAGATKKGLLLLVGLPLTILAIFALVSPVLVWSLGRSGLLGWFIAIAAAGYYMWKDRDMWRDIPVMLREGGQWIRGGQGELRVDRVLGTLPPEFAVFHDYHPVRVDGENARWNVDHVVVGPTGVFVIETKNYSRGRVRPARPGSFEQKNVKQAQTNANELKDKLRLWSGGQLGSLFVVPVLVYAQDGAFVEKTREGSVRVIPLKWLVGEIERHSEANIDVERAGRVVGVLYNQLNEELKLAFRPEMDAYGKLSKQARYEKRDAAVAAAANQAPDAAEAAVCPRCGGRLVRRTAKTGARKGKDFMGCENFRTTGCRYGVNID